MIKLFNYIITVVFNIFFACSCAIIIANCCCYFNRVSYYNVLHVIVAVIAIIIANCCCYFNRISYYNVLHVIVAIIATLIMHHNIMYQ